jgi:hypothetical protein
MKRRQRNKITLRQNGVTLATIAKRIQENQRYYSRRLRGFKTAGTPGQAWDALCPFCGEVGCLNIEPVSGAWWGAVCDVRGFDTFDMEHQLRGRGLIVNLDGSDSRDTIGDDFDRLIAEGGAA